MAIAFVGSKTFGHQATSTASVSLTDIKDDANVSTAPAANDVVFAWVAQSNPQASGARTLAQLTPTGYTAITGSVITASDTHLVTAALFYKVMGGTPDTTITVPASQATTAGLGVAITVLRNVDTTTPAGTPQTANAANTGVANPPSVTPTISGSWILVGGAAAVAVATAFTIPADLDATSARRFPSLAFDATTNDVNVALGLKINWTSGVFDGAAFGGSTSTNTGSWAAVAVAIQPLLATATATPTLDALTSTAAGAVQVKASSTPTLSALTSAATGTIIVAGSASPTLGAVVGAAVGKLSIAATTVAALADLTAVSASVLSSNNGHHRRRQFSASLGLGM